MCAFAAYHYHAAKVKRSTDCLPKPRSGSSLNFTDKNPLYDILRRLPVRNEEIRKRTGLRKLEFIIEERRLRLGHV